MSVRDEVAAVIYGDGFASGSQHQAIRAAQLEVADSVIAWFADRGTDSENE